MPTEVSTIVRHLRHGGLSRELDIQLRNEAADELERQKAALKTIADYTKKGRGALWLAAMKGIREVAEKALQEQDDDKLS